MKTPMSAAQKAQLLEEARREELALTVRQAIVQKVAGIGAKSHKDHIAILGWLYNKLFRHGIHTLEVAQRNAHAEIFCQQAEDLLREYAEEGDIKKNPDRYVADVKLLVVRDMSREKPAPARQPSLPSPYPQVKPKEAKDRMQAVNEAREWYCCVGISIMADGAAVSINNGKNEIQSGPLPRSWESDDHFSQGRIKDRANAQLIPDVVAAMIETLIITSGLAPSRIQLITAAIAGNVDRNTGVVGPDFQTLRLPFYKFPLKDKLSDALREYGITADIHLVNDAEASRNGERFALRGKLKGKTGGVVFIGESGWNISVDDPSIQEAGHNLIQWIDEQGAMHYKWVGHLSRGVHPIDTTKSREEIIQASGDMGNKYVDLGEELFKKQNPDFPIIDPDGQEEDVEDRLTGEAIQVRFHQVLQTLEQEGSEEVEQYRAILEEAKNHNNAYEQALNIEAEADNPVAIDWIERLGCEVGFALAAFISFYRGSPFVKHLVLVGKIGRYLGKDIYPQEATAQEIDLGIDLFIRGVRFGAMHELVNHFQMETQEAEDLTNSIVRSDLGDERELIFYHPSDKEVVDSHEAFRKSQHTSAP